MSIIKTGKWLKKELLNLGMTQKELANKAGLSVPTISKILSEERYGSEETWSRINNVIGNIPSISSANSGFIDELKEEISKYNEQTKCFVFYENVGGNILFKEFSLIEEYDCQDFPKSDLKKLSKLEITLKEALELFEYQDQDKVARKKE